MAKKSKFKLNWHVLLLFAVPLLLVLLGIQAVIINDLYARTDQLKTQELKAVLIDGVNGLNTEPAVDPQTGRHYLPGVRLVLPAKLESRIVYRGDDDTSPLWVSSLGVQLQAANRLRAAETLTDTYKEVSMLQKCVRQVQVMFNKPDPSDSPDTLMLKNTEKLRDGRTAYIYQNDCPFGAEPLLRDLSQMQSY